MSHTSAGASRDVHPSLLAPSLLLQVACPLQQAPPVHESEVMQYNVIIAERLTARLMIAH